MKTKGAILSTLLCLGLASSVLMTLSATSQARPRKGDEVEAPADSGSKEPAASITPEKDKKFDAVGAARKLSETDALALWRSATAMAAKGNVDQAVDSFQSLLDADQDAVGQDLILMTAARLFYDRGQFEKSISYYMRVPRSSDYWLDSIEERSWAQIRLDRMNDAFSGLTTLMTKTLAAQVGPEAFYERSYLAFKKCDFGGVFKAIDLFNEEFQPRSHRLSQLVKNPHDALTEAFLNRLSHERVTMVSLGKGARDIPRLAQRDQKLLLYAKAKNWPLAYKRIGELAARDLEETAKIVRKMLVVQTETIEYMNLQESDKGAKLNHVQLDKNQIRFPYSDKEVWLDELDHYHAQSAGCVQKKGG